MGLDPEFFRPTFIADCSEKIDCRASRRVLFLLRTGESGRYTADCLAPTGKFIFENHMRYARDCSSGFRDWQVRFDSASSWTYEKAGLIKNSGNEGEP